MRRSDFLLALTASRLVLMLVEIVLLLGLGVLAFDMRVLGRYSRFCLLNTVGRRISGSWTAHGQPRSKIESVSGLMNLVMMPMDLSGVFFSSERFPTTLQPVIKLLPLTALNDACGPHFAGRVAGAQSGRILVLLVWGGISFILACAGSAGLSSYSWSQSSCKRLHSHLFPGAL